MAVRHRKDIIRDARAIRWAIDLQQDLKYAFRMIRRDPALAIVITVTLAFAIGGNSAIFSVVNGVLLRPLDLPHPDRLVVISARTPARAEMPVAYPDLLDWQARQATFDSLAGSLVVGGVLTGGGAPERVFGRAVSRNFFSTLGAPLAAGRTFTEAEDRPGGDRVMVLNYGLWQRRYGGDRGIVGRAVLYNSEPYTVVGVLPARFDYYGRSNANNDFFVPLGHLAANDYMRDRASHPVRVVGRMKAGVSIARAQSDLATIAAALAEAHPESNKNVGVQLRSLLDDYVGDVRLALTVLQAAAALVLAIACANIANLLLGRAATRRREFALRVALGAGRLRTARQLLTESLTLSIAGGLAGLAVGSAAVRVIGSLAPASLPRVDDVVFDWRVLGFTALLTVAAAVCFGAAPALQASGVDLRRFLSEGGRSLTPRARRLREGLVVAEVAVCIALLTGAGLLARSFDALLRVDPGFDPGNVVVMRVRLPDGKYRERARVTDALDQVLTRVSALPGVESACLTTGVPFGRSNDERYVIDGRPVLSRDRMPVALTQWVSVACLRTFRIDLVAGRYLAETDRESSPSIAIVDEEFVRRAFPGAPPTAALGHRLQLGAEPERWREIVGVVRHIHHSALDEIAVPQVYAPHRQMDPAWQLEIGRAMDLAVRTTRDSGSVVADVRKEVFAIEPDAPLSHVRTLDDALSSSVAPRVFNLTLLGLFAAVALVLCVVGLYGAMSYSVTQRTREIGVRVALGAEPGEVMRLLMKRAARMLLAGVVLGTVAALVAGRLLRGLLYAVHPADPATIGAAATLLSCVALLATYLPARRATRVDPLTALRSD